jgi:hypothetical protein
VLTSLEVRNVGGDLLTLPLGDDSSGFIIQDIEGLEPVKATLVSSSFANMDGAQYHTSRREPRNLKLKFEIEPDYILDSVSGGLVVGINGRVESFDSPLFTKDPTADISLMCYDPDFVDIDSTLISGSTTSGTDETLIEYDGTVETGFVFSLHVDRALTDFTIYHRPPDDVVRTLDFTGTLGAGDELVVSTIAGSKGATLISGSTETSVLYGVSPQSNWIELQPGANYIRVYATGAAIPFDIEYNTRYGGL